MDIVYATGTRHVGTGVVHKGSHWPADDPIVRAHPDLFSDDPRYGLSYTAEPDGWDAPVEQATKAPGEKRATRRARD
jgi:hypothetical protein